jgi:hypothetical protein
MILKILDVLRIVLVAGTFYFGNRIGYANGYDPIAQLHFMIPLIILAIAGISGMEGLLFARQAAEIKGYEVGSNYQRQSAIALLSYAFMAVVVYFSGWGIRAELTLFFTFVFFFFFSAVNHAVDAVRRKNYRWQNINRPLLILLLIAGMIYPVIMALQIIGRS